MTKIRLTIIVGFLAVSAGIGCGKRAVPIPSDAEISARDSVFAVLDRMNTQPFRESFDQLPRYSYERYIRTEQFDDEDFVMAYDEFLLRTVGNGAARSTSAEHADSAGQFEFGFFNKFVSENVESVDPVDLVPFVLPDDIGYDNPRDVDRYRFRFLPDSLLWDHQARVIEIRARPELADGLNIRVVRQYVDSETETLLGVYLERIDLGLLFREESAFYVDVREAPDGRFVPYNTRFESKIKTPFRGAYKIRTVSTFSEFQALRNP